MCGCKKKYLSYPALYTHIKQKHGGIAPPGTNTSQLFTGRGRGRPRKSLAPINDRNMNHKMDESYSSNSNDDYFGNYNSKGPSDDQLAQLNQRVLEERSIFAELKADAGPTNANDWYCDVTKISFSLSKMREIAEANVLGGVVELEQAQKVEMAAMAQEYVDSIYPIFYELNNY